MYFRKNIGWLLATMLFSSAGVAADLLQICRLALENDAQFLAARYQRDAGLEKLPQGVAGLLPTLGATANTQWNDVDRQLRGVDSRVQAQYNSNAYLLTLSQPLFRWQNVLAYQQGKLQSVQADVEFAQARQEVILRAAQAYFDVLYAQENLRALQAQKEAITQQLAQARKNFEVGSATIVDTHEAQSRFDLALSQEIAAVSDLEVKRRALEVIVGQDPGILSPVNEKAQLERPQPEVVTAWVEAAEKNAYAVQSQELLLEIAAKEAERNRAGHLPTLDAVVTYGRSLQTAALPVGTGASVIPGYETLATTAALQLSLPLFQGGSVNSKVREAEALREAAAQKLTFARRDSGQAARQAYLGVVNGAAQVAALKAALQSSQSALDSNKLGYEVGVRINIDVLNAEQQLYVTRRELAKAWFDTLLAQLRLKSAVGALEEADLGKVNALLQP